MPTAERPRTVERFVEQLAARVPALDHPPLNGRHVVMHGTCGLGHRLLRNARIFHAARSAGYAVRVGWAPWSELFTDSDELFGSPRDAPPTFRFGNEPSEIQPVSASDCVPAIVLYGDLDVTPSLRFDIAGCPDEMRWTREVFGPGATDHTADFHLRLASQLRPERVDRIDRFVSRAVGDRELVAVHVRTGNGETGDFVNKNRAIPLDQVMRDLAAELEHRAPDDTAVLVASDSLEPAAVLETLTDHEVHTFTSTLPSSGHITGDWVAPNTSVEREGHRTEWVVENFSDAYADLLLLGMADHLYASAWSSFLTGPMLMNRRRADLGTTAKIYDRVERRWRAV